MMMRGRKHERAPEILLTQPAAAALGLGVSFGPRPDPSAVCAPRTRVLYELFPCSPDPPYRIFLFLPRARASFVRPTHRLPHDTRRVYTSLAAHVPSPQSDLQNEYSVGGLGRAKRLLSDASAPPHHYPALPWGTIHSSNPSTYRTLLSGTSGRPISPPTTDRQGKDRHLSALFSVSFFFSSFASCVR